MVNIHPGMQFEQETSGDGGCKCLKRRAFLPKGSIFQAFLNTEIPQVGGNKGESG